MGRRNKLLSRIGGVPMVRRVVDAALGSACAATWVVTGHDADQVADALGDTSVTCVFNAQFDEGIASSLRCALQALPAQIDAALILLADMPKVNSGHIDRLLAAFDVASPKIVAPERDGRRGNPVLWPRHLFAELMALRGDVGGRSLFAAHAAQCLFVHIDDDAIFSDIDTPDDLTPFV